MLRVIFARRSTRQSDAGPASSADGAGRVAKANAELAEVGSPIIAGDQSQTEVEDAARRAQVVTDGRSGPDVDMGRRFARAPEFIDLPFDMPRVAQPSREYGSVTLQLPADLSRQLAQTEVDERGMGYSTLLGVFMALVYRYSGHGDIVVACSPVAQTDLCPTGNDHTILFRGRLSDEVALREVAADLNQQMGTAEGTGPATLESVIAQLGSAWSPGQSALTQLAFQLADQVLTSRAVNASPRDSLPSSSVGLGPDLSLTVRRNDGRWTVDAQYNIKLFHESTVRRLLGHYCNLLRSALAEPAVAIADLPMLDEAERRQLLVDWNQTYAEVPRDVCVHQLIEAQVARTPDATAVVYVDQRVSYGELNDRANQLAHCLRERGVGAGTVVSIYMERSLDAIVAMLGVLKAGGAYLPLDASYPLDRLSYILHDARAPFLLTRGSASHLIDTAETAVIDFAREQQELARYPCSNLPNVAQQAAVAFVLYTSGSTGNPKGVLVTHGNLVNYFFAWERHCGLRDHVSAVVQMAYFSFAVFQGDVVRCLCAGKKLVICPKEVLLSPRELYALMQREHVDMAEFVPSLLRALLAFVETTDRSLDFMRVLAVGADRWYVREHERVRQRVGLQTRLLHVYGSSETTLDSTFFESTDLPLQKDQLVPIGRPISNVQAYVLDAKLQPVPIGVVGELFIGGAGVARGYCNRPELTAEKFIADPFTGARGARLFKTGDLARYMADGDIAFLGRRDHQVKIQGFRVEPGEIESVLEQHATVESAIVQPWATAHESQQLVAYVVAAKGHACDAAVLRQHLRTTLPAFMVPAHIIVLDALPLTPSGKIDRSSLPPPLPADAASAASSVDAIDVASQIVQICRHALDAKDLQASDEFWRVGIDSMGMVAIVTGIEEAFGISVDEEDITLDLLSSAATVAAYVQRKLEQQGGSHSSRISSKLVS